MFSSRPQPAGSVQGSGTAWQETVPVPAPTLTGFVTLLDDSFTMAPSRPCTYPCTQRSLRGSIPCDPPGTPEDRRPTRSHHETSTCLPMSPGRPSGDRQLLLWAPMRCMLSAPPPSGKSCKIQPLPQLQSRRGTSTTGYPFCFGVVLLHVWGKDLGELAFLAYSFHSPCK